MRTRKPLPSNHQGHLNDPGSPKNNDSPHRPCASHPSHSSVRTYQRPNHITRQGTLWWAVQLRETVPATGPHLPVSQIPHSGGVSVCGLG